MTTLHNSRVLTDGITLGYGDCMANGEDSIQLTRDEALNLLGAIEDAIAPLAEGGFLTEVLDLERAGVEVLVARLFPELPQGDE